MGHEQLNIRIPAGLANDFDRKVKRLGQTKTEIIVNLLLKWTQPETNEPTATEKGQS